MTTWRRRDWIAVSACAAAGRVLPARAADAAAVGTRWTFELAQAYDALEFAVPHAPALVAHGDVSAEDVAFSRRLTWAVRARLERVEAHHPNNPPTNVEDVITGLIRAFDPLRPRTVHDLRAGVRRVAQTGPRWFADRVTDIDAVLDALIALDFDGYWSAHVRPRVEQRIAARRADLAESDPAGVVSDFIGVPVDPDVTLLVGAFAPWGQPIHGQRIYTYSGMPRLEIIGRVADVLLRDTYARTVANDSALNRAANALRADRFLMPRVHVENVAEGYDLLGYVHECSMEALNMAVQRRLGTPHELPDSMWRSPSTANAARVFAEALYALLLRDEYPAGAHGPFRDTLLRYITGDGPLAPGRVEATYRQLVGTPQK